MLTPLGPRFRLPYQEAETATSYLARSARFLGRPILTFCERIGVRLGDVRDGKPESLEALGFYTSTSADRLRDGVLVRLDPDRFSLRGALRLTGMTARPHPWCWKAP